MGSMSSSPTDQTAPDNSPSIGARINRLPVLRSHRFIAFVIGLGVFFDQYENFLAPIMSTVLEKHFHLDGTDLSLVLASGFLGQCVGALGMGRLADRIGRQHTFIINLLIYSIASIVCGLAPHAAVLVMARFVTGIGIGGEYALADSYLADILPARVRGRYIVGAYTISFFGVPLSGFLARWLVPLQPLGVEGWRWMFIIGGIGGLVVWMIRSVLPESPTWLEAHGRTDEAEKIVRRWEEEAQKAGHALSQPDTHIHPAPHTTVHFSEIFAPTVRKRTTVVSIMSTLQVFGYYGFGSVATLALAAKGFSVVDSIGYTAVTYIGYPVGSLLMIPLIDRFERKHLIVVTAGMMVVVGLIFGFSPTPAVVMIAGGVFTASSNMFSGAYHTYLPENFPTRIRGTASGFAYSLSKMSAAIMPFILLPILHHAGSGPVFIVVAVVLIVMMFIIGVFGARTTGRTADVTVGANTGSIPREQASR